MTINLEEASIEEFQTLIYKDYVKLFPRSERRGLHAIKKTMKRKVTNVLKIMVDGVYVGFFIYNSLPDNPYMQLDYFAILPEYQSKGYGSLAIKTLQEMYYTYAGIYIEIEKLGLGKNEKENKLREKRAKFYDRLGFCPLSKDISLSGVVYATYVLPITANQSPEPMLYRYIFDIYTAVGGKLYTKLFCKILEM